jgi:hypothetical protein
MHACLPLVVLSLLFLLSLVLFVPTVLGDHHAHHSNPERSSAGSAVRRWLHRLLVVACGLRGVCGVAEAALVGGHVCPGSTGCIALRRAPALPFLSSYALLVLLWAQLTSVSSRTVVLFLGVNGVIYAGVAALVLGGAVFGLPAATLDRWLCAALALFSTVVLGLTVAYGYSVARQLSALSSAAPSGGGAHNHLGKIRTRLIMLSTLSGAALAAHAALYWSVASGFEWGHSTAPLVATDLLSELLPALVIMQLMRRKTAKKTGTAPGSRSGLGGLVGGGGDGGGGDDGAGTPVLINPFGNDRSSGNLQGYGTIAGPGSEAKAPLLVAPASGGETHGRGRAVTDSGLPPVRTTSLF